MSLYALPPRDGEFTSGRMFKIILQNQDFSVLDRIKHIFYSDSMSDLYTEEFKKIMKVNSDHTSMSSNRVEEIMNFSPGAGFKRIGIAHCITFRREARLLKDYFSKCFEVYTIDCKYGRIPKKDIIGGSSMSIACNPAGQADFLNQKHTELNISMGL